jgi:hypothetical protein
MCIVGCITNFIRLVITRELPCMHSVPLGGINEFTKLSWGCENARYLAEK